MLRCPSSLRHCGVFRGHVPIPLGFRNMSPTPHSSGLARLACGLFRKPPRRIFKTAAKRRAEAILAEVGLEDRITHKPGELSGGEQQRVAIARALILEPDIILTDEPTGNLDTETGKKIEDILLTLNQTKRTTLIVVTHNQSLADRMSHQIGLRDGRMYSRE